MKPPAVLLACLVCVFAAVSGVGPARAQTAPPPPPSASIIPPPPPPGLSPELADASKLMREGQYATALLKVDTALAANPRSPQARFMKAVIQSEQGDIDAARETFQTLTSEFPELPEPHNNLAVIQAQRGEYDLARSELELALKANPDYGVAHENLGDVYTRLAGNEYLRATAADKNNKSAQTKLGLIKDLYAVLPSLPPPQVIVPKPKTPSPPRKK